MSGPQPRVLVPQRGRVAISALASSAELWSSLPTDEASAPPGQVLLTKQGIDDLSQHLLAKQGTLIQVEMSKCRLHARKHLLLS